jgi:transcriptional regulator with XRE-family HTH domain
VSDRREADPRLRKFGARLRALREERNLTLEQLAEAAGVGVRQLARVEGGRGSPSFLWMLDVANGLGVRPEELLG